MIECLLIVDFTQKPIFEFIKNETKIQKIELIKKVQENCKDETSRFCEILETEKKALFGIKDKFGNCYISITDNKNSKNKFIFEFLLKIENKINKANLETSKIEKNLEKEILKILDDYNKNEKINVIHDLSVLVKNKENEDFSYIEKSENVVLLSDNNNKININKKFFIGFFILLILIIIISFFFG